MDNLGHGEGFWWEECGECFPDQRGDVDGVENIFKVPQELDCGLALSTSEFGMEGS